MRREERPMMSRRWNAGPESYLSEGQRRWKLSASRPAWPRARHGVRADQRSAAGRVTGNAAAPHEEGGRGAGVSCSGGDPNLTGRGTCTPLRAQSMGHVTGSYITVTENGLPVEGGFPPQKDDRTEFCSQTSRGTKTE